VLPFPALCCKGLQPPLIFLRAVHCIIFPKPPDARSNTSIYASVHPASIASDSRFVADPTATFQGRSSFCHCTVLRASAANAACRCSISSLASFWLHAFIWAQPWAQSKLPSHSLPQSLADHLHFRACLLRSSACRNHARMYTQQPAALSMLLCFTAGTHSGCAHKIAACSSLPTDSSSKRAALHYLMTKTYSFPGVGSGAHFKGHWMFYPMLLSSPLWPATTQPPSCKKARPGCSLSIQG
jgi:hypothetical protein